MSTSQVLDRTFSLYRENFLLFAGITALPPALILIGQVLFLLATKPMSGVTFGGPVAPAPDAPDFAKVALGTMAFIVLLICAMVGYAFASGASVYAVSRVHLGHKTTITESYRLIGPHFGNILGIVVIVGICIFVVLGVGLACVFVPFFLGVAGRGLQGFSPPIVMGILVGGVVCLAAIVLAIYLSARLSLAVPSCVLEKLGVFDSIRRSWWLSQGSILRLILVLILAAIFASLLSTVLSIPYFIGIAMAFTKKDPALLVPFVVWQYFAEFISRTVAGPLSTIAAALIYYDQRVRKEAFDLQLMMEAIGQPVPPQPVAPPPFVG
jgi:hypothetical protein